MTFDLEKKTLQVENNYSPVMDIKDSNEIKNDNDSKGFIHKHVSNLIKNIKDAYQHVF